MLSDHVLMDPRNAEEVMMDLKCKAGELSSDPLISETGQLISWVGVVPYDTDFRIRKKIDLFFFYPA